jgi:murein DD-endopeptidase MepM/ murein hydrolase activator NlpD
VRAAGPGVVQVAGEDPVYGLHVMIDHGRGLETVYGHASRLFVSVGDTVRRGRLIAFSGSTGRSTAPHLHFEVRLDGMAVDPLTYVRQP